MNFANSQKKFVLLHRHNDLADTRTTGPSAHQRPTDLQDPNKKMDIYTVESLPGVQYELLGIVTGSTIQSKNAIHDFGAEMKSIFGGELRSYTNLMEQSRRQAQERMVAEAQKLGADAIIGVRFTTSAIMAQASEVLMYGTAIRYK